MTPTFTRDRITWLAYLMLAFYAYFLNSFGPITPFLKSEMSLSYTLSSFHFSAFALGMIAAGLGGHLLIERIGRWRALWTGAVGMSLSGLLLISTRLPALTITSSFLMGLVGSLILAVVPSLLSDHHGEMRTVAISEANVIASVVSAAAPLLVGWFAPSIFGWRAALAVGACLPLVMRLLLGKGIKLPAASEAEDSSLKGQPLPARYWVFWSALVLAVSVEFCMVFWCADFLEKQLGVPKTSAAQAVSLFLGGMILGRWACSRLVTRFRTETVVVGSLLAAAAGFLVFWLAPVPWLSSAGLFVCGLGVAGLYPLLLSLAVGSASGSSVQAGALSSLASGAAIFSLPLVLGRLADGFGIRSAYGVILFLLAGVLVIVLGAVRLQVKTAHPAQSGQKS